MPSGRPRVLVNCAISLDGKLQLAPARRAGPFAMSRGREDHRRMRALRARADAVIIGAENLRVDDPDLALLDDERARRHANGVREPLRIVVTRAAAGIDPSRRIFDPALGGEAVVAHSHALPPEHLRALEGVATVLGVGGGAPVAPSSAARSGDVGVDLPGLLRWLAEERACHTVLVEGGGIINAAFFAARAVDEVFATLVPRILGGKDAPSLVGGPGFAADEIPDARLLELERHGDELYLHYAFDWR
jgi:riboflavin-specific deaminase-like protein